MYGFWLPMRMKKRGRARNVVGLGLCDPVVDRLGDLVALRIHEQLVDVEPRDLGGDLADQVVGDPARVLGALVAVERLLQVPEPVLESGRRARSAAL